MPIHVVKSGETIYSIAQLYDVSADRIVYDNELGNAAKSCSGASSFDSDDEPGSYCERRTDGGADRGRI